MHAMYASIWPEVLGDHGIGRRPHESVAGAGRPLPARSPRRRRWQDAAVVRRVANAAGLQADPRSTASCAACPA